VKLIRTGLRFAKIACLLNKQLIHRSQYHHQYIDLFTGINGSLQRDCLYLIGKQFLDIKKEEL